jgi:hypothetical protein
MATTTKLAIIIFPDDEVKNGINPKNYPPSIFGSRVSSLEGVKVNTINGGYTIIFSYSMIAECNPEAVADILRSIMLKMEPNGTRILIYHLVTLLNHPKYSFEFMTKMYAIYLRTSKFDDINIKLGTTMRDLFENHDVNEDLYDDEDEEPAGIDMNLYSRANKKDNSDLWLENANLLNMELNVKGKKKKKKSSKDKDKDKDDIAIKKSAIYKSSDHPKRDVKKYGLIRIEDKDDIKKDYKQLLAVTKDFIPGNEKWKKEFRQNLAARWLMSYAVTKKKLKKLQSVRNKDNSKSETVKKISKSLYNTSSIWTNPKR